MKKSTKELLIVSVVGIALVCSVIVIVSESGNVTSVSEEVSSPENIPEGHKMLPPLTSHEEAISLADEFLVETFGEEFFHDHFAFSRIEERPDLGKWFVIYEYTSHGYTVDMRVAVNSDHIRKNRPRVDVLFSYIILEPQEILISEEEAKRIAQEYGLEPPYMKLTLSCKFELRRICWIVVREDVKYEELKGVAIDAENGTVLQSWIEL
ncbi:MAG: hypothetical protein AYK18_17595 [Theionarchaea archaeon DG-70]|nr:MAG: hypothetical protein AYK18_17595 [Theionarchaea archaeon DG-70]